MKEIDLTIPKGAVFSDDGKYRYALWRVWSKYKKPLMFIGLNPSTANQFMDDPTISRLTTRANNDGFGSILVGNLYAIVSSNPNILIRQNIDVIGIETDEYLKQMVQKSNLVLCAWGSFKAVEKRASEVLKFLPNPYCLGINKNGQPKHPLYISYNTPMIIYNKKKE